MRAWRSLSAGLYAVLRPYVLIKRIYYVAGFLCCHVLYNCKGRPLLFRLNEVLGQFEEMPLRLVLCNGHE